ncbi:MAG: DUF3617 domain-containing protein [Gammaproteobacteria bacterium]
MMKYLVFMAGAAVLAVTLAGTAAARTINLQPGFWVMTANAEVANRPRLHAESVTKRCITRADSRHNRIVPHLETRPGMSCTLMSFSRSGNTATYTRVCTNHESKLTAHGKIKFISPVAYRATVQTTGRIRGHLVSTTRTVHAKRVGNCGR